MSDLQWAADGSRIFEKLMNAVPEAMRDMIKPKLLEFLAAKAAGAPVTREVVTRMVQEDLPEPQRGIIMQALGIKPPKEKKAEKKDTASAPAPVSQEAWEGDSQSMFETMLQEVPESLRDVFRGKLMDILKQKAQGGAFKEAQVVEIVNEIVPEPFKSNILKAFATMGGVDTRVVEKIITSFSGGQESVIAILHALQAQFSYLPSEALRMVSQAKGVSLSTLYRLVTSYRAFRTDSSKKHTVTVCNGTGCHLKGGGELLKRLEEKVSKNESEITLQKARCLGCCDLSPALEVNGEVCGGDEARAKVSELIGE
jgi:NADH:ubiquinone oxidoreductase subunit E